jgi:uncharacterized membrane protein YphA (DoxX/SURF4 family)
MNIVIWIVQGLLAAIFLMAGIMKSTQPKEKLSKNMAWANDVSASNIKLIGVLELLAVIGLVLPHITGILPWLTPLAAIGLVLTMIGAIIVHAKRNENSAIGINIVLLLLAAFVAYGRFILIPA